MKDPWWRSILSVVEHVSASSGMFVVVTVAAVFGSRIIAIASQQIESKFVNDVLSLLKCAIVVAEAIFVLVTLVKSTVKSIRSSIR